CVPAAAFGRAGATVGVLNVGGTPYLPLLRDGSEMLGFDCGPGNALMDGWCAENTGAAYDDDGRWAASGRVLPGLLQELLAEPFFALPPPKSTGRDLFNRPWLQARLKGHGSALPADVQATLTEMTARACAADAQR